MSTWYVRLPTLEYWNKPQSTLKIAFDVCSNLLSRRCLFICLFVCCLFLSHPRGEHSRNTVRIDIASCTLAAAVAQQAACCAPHDACCWVARRAFVLQPALLCCKLRVMLQALLLSCKLRCCVASCAPFAREPAGVDALLAHKLPQALRT